MFSNNFKLYLINFFLIKAILSDETLSEDFDIIRKYGSTTTSKKKVFIETTDFDVGDNIYISLEFEGNFILNSELTYIFLKETYENKINYKTKTYQSTSSSSANGKTKKTYNYEIKKDDNEGNYLLLLLNNFPSPITVKNTKEDSSSSNAATIIGIIFALFFFIFFVVLIICLCKRCRRSRLPYGAVGYGSSIGYGISPYGVPPPMMPGQPMQPVMNIQPYGQNYPINSRVINVQNNRGDQITEGSASSNRMDQNPNNINQKA